MKNEKKPATILLVDDAPMNLKILAAMFRKLGTATVEVGSGAAALAYVSAHQEVDAIVTDLWMLEMNGAELAKAVHAYRPRLPVFAITADSEIHENKDFQTPHLEKILIKPVAIEQLQEILAQISGKK